MTLSERKGSGPVVWLPALVLGLAITAARAGAAPADWKTYRSSEFGYELSYPPTLELKPFWGGSSAELRDAGTGDRVADIELWPGGVCPRQAANTTAKTLGMDRSAAVTQADGPDGSSACADPRVLEEFVSERGVRIYALELVCTEERFGNEEDGVAASTLARQALGKKGPTFFADVSQAWRTRVLMVDTVGTDPRLQPAKRTADPVVVRNVLRTLAVFPVPRPDGICIEDLR